MATFFFTNFFAQKYVVVNDLVESIYRGSPLSTVSLSTILGIVQFQIVLNSMDIVRFSTDSPELSTDLLKRISSLTIFFYLYFKLSGVGGYKSYSG
jgi:hypothetical protein